LDGDRAEERDRVGNMCTSKQASPVAYFSKLRVHDVAAISPLLLWYVLMIYGSIPQLRADLQRALATSGWRPLSFVELFSEIATIIFFSLMIVIFFARRLPIARAEGVLPRLVAIVAANLEFLIGALPHQHLEMFWSTVSTVVLAAGIGATLYVICYLGRNFSILPQARGLVTGGPYAHIRHPLYLVEGINVLDVMPQYKQPWALLIVGIVFALQIVRMHYEEEVLARTFPEYRDYAARTARLLPGIY
jgi:protein-S-isoprenylcysteine O-methyltransferase Ste14